MCVPDDVKNIKVKVFNRMSRTNETRHRKWHETCQLKCRLDASVCNNKQRWNGDKCKFECNNYLIKVYSIRDLFGILVVAGVNVINHMMLGNVCTKEVQKKKKKNHKKIVDKLV